MRALEKKYKKYTIYNGKSVYVQVFIHTCISIHMYRLTRREFGFLFKSVCRAALRDAHFNLTTLHIPAHTIHCTLSTVVAINFMIYAPIKFTNLAKPLALTRTKAKSSKRSKTESRMWHTNLCADLTERSIVSA